RICISVKLITLHYGATFTIKDGRLIFVEKGNQKSTTDRITQKGGGGNCGLYRQNCRRWR
ncbi:MAG: hypothetical protein M3Z67_09005, partial [Commensalibacter sp.]|nr:hypothetical protein [Commensalibacter sp.]